MQIEAETKESSPHEKHAPASIVAQPDEWDAVAVASTLDVHDLAPTSSQDIMDAETITIVQDGHDAAAMLEKSDASPVIGSKLVL